MTNPRYFQDIVEILPFLQKVKFQGFHSDLVQMDASIPFKMSLSEIFLVQSDGSKYSVSTRGHFSSQLRVLWVFLVGGIALSRFRVSYYTRRIWGH